MPFVLRGVRKSKWYKSENVPWLLDNQLQADALTDIGTLGNTLSLWLIESDEANLARVVTALASKRDTVSNYDYFIIDVEIITTLDIYLHSTSGDTPDKIANELWHLDAIELTASKLMALAEVIRTSARIHRLQKKQVRKLLQEAIQKGEIDTAKVTEKLFHSIFN